MSVSKMTGMKWTGVALLGHGVITIEWWCTGQRYHHGVLWGILSREATKKGSAHVDTSRDELRNATGQRWERLVRRLEQVGISCC
jgi:hypothetical protein